MDSPEARNCLISSFHSSLLRSFLLCGTVHLYISNSIHFHLLVIARKLQYYNFILCNRVGFCRAYIALELIAEKKSIMEIATEYNMPKSTILEWKEKLLNEAQKLFIPAYEKERQIKKLKDTVSDLHKLIGEITIENNFLKKNYRYK